MEILSITNLIHWLLSVLNIVLAGRGESNSFGKVEWVSFEHSGCCLSWSLVSWPPDSKMGQRLGAVNPAFVRNSTYAPVQIR